MKQRLDDAQRLASNEPTTCRTTGTTRDEALKQRLEIAEQDLKWHHVLLHWIEQERLVMVRNSPTVLRKDYCHGNAAPRAMRKTPAHGRRTKQAKSRTTLGKVKITKPALNKQNTTIRKPRAVCKPPSQNLDILRRNYPSQTSAFSREEFRLIRLDGSLSQCQPRSAFTTKQFPCTNGDPLCRSESRGVVQVHCTKREYWPSPPRQAQSCLAFRTRSGRMSRPPIRWGSCSGNCGASADSVP